jgi:hypothetical protein
VRPFLGNSFFWLVIFSYFLLFLIEITIISSIWVKMISLRENCFLRFIFLMWVREFFRKLRPICSWCVKRLSIWIKLIILDENLCFRHTLSTILSKVFRIWVKRNLIFLIFHSWHYFLTHLWFLSWKMFSICRVNIIVRPIRLCFYIV